MRTIYSRHSSIARCRHRVAVVPKQGRGASGAFAVAALGRLDIANGSKALCWAAPGVGAGRLSGCNPTAVGRELLSGATEAVAVGALSIQDGGGSHLFLCDLAVLLVDAQADGRVACACAKVRDSWQLVNGVLPRLSLCARGSGRGGSGRGGRRRSCSGGWHWNFGGDRLAERGWAILGMVVAVGVAPEVSARWENAFVGGLDLKSREGVGLSGRGRGAGRVCAEECEDSDEHEKRRGNGAKDRAGQSPRLRFGGHLHDEIGRAHV